MGNSCTEVKEQDQGYHRVDKLAHHWKLPWFNINKVHGQDLGNNNYTREDGSLLCSLA